MTEWVETLVEGRFGGQTIIVTGAGSGIGRAVALRIAREGGRVVAVDLSAEHLDQLARDAAHANVVACAADVTNEDDVRRVVEIAGDRIDGLANVAAVMDEFGAVHEVGDAVWERVLTVNVMGPVRMMRATLPSMIRHNSGSIVNVASVAVFRSAVAGVAYTASKHALIGVTRNSAAFYGGVGIRINAVAPGTSRPTRLTADLESASGLVRSVIEPMRPLRPAAARPEEIAASIVFLLSADGTNINGATLATDGGYAIL